MRYCLEYPANRYVFKSRLNCSESTAGSLRQAGSEFQTAGPATENGYSCGVDSNVYGQRLLVDGRSPGAVVNRSADCFSSHVRTFCAFSMQRSCRRPKWDCTHCEYEPARMVQKSRDTVYCLDSMHETFRNNTFRISWISIVFSVLCFYAGVSCTSWATKNVPLVFDYDSGVF